VIKGKKVVLADLYNSLKTGIEKLNPFDCALYLTLIILMIERPDYQSIVLVSSIAVIVRPLVHSAAYWIVILLIFLVVHWQPWYSVANHHYLQAYWMMGIAICFVHVRREEALRHRADG
jgi:hypothetical protein